MVRALAEWEAAFVRDDPRFAEGLRRGRPVAPREYRWNRWVVALAVTQAAALTLGATQLAVLCGLAMALAAWRRTAP